MLIYREKERERESQTEPKLDLNFSEKKARRTEAKAQSPSAGRFGSGETREASERAVHKYFLTFLCQ